MKRWWKKIVGEGLPPFTTHLNEAQGVPVLKVSGDIILDTEPKFRAALRKAVAEVEQIEGLGHVLVVDLSETEFMDSVGLGTLIGETEELRKRGGEVRLVIPPLARVRRLLEVTGVVDMFRVYSELPSATDERRGGT